MCVFTRNSAIEVQFVIWLQNTDRRALLFIDNQRLIGFLTNKPEQYLQTKVLMP